ncbi:hypothetical protein AM493_19250 [Flavobacterium akiainvivens]|uniref:Uncharacterized protein n=2 Tax=Flavobacterium akiainvivens TaxID=1202724 RepID=A0A0M8MBX1_9FLAO|nr:hypothetical protein AM493_19250 [Flavobacterium akiainvivens]SFQ29572.1 hypothetical protein SAMN05444144_102432 [Flavobacterium akiainvivens]
MLGFALILLLLTVVFSFQKISGYRRNITALRLVNTMHFQFSEFSNICLLHMMQAHHNEKNVIIGAIQDDFASTLTALRLGFESNAERNSPVDEKTLNFVGMMQDAYNRVKLLNPVSYHSCEAIFEIIRQLVRKASDLSGHKIQFKALGFSGKISSSCEYLLFLLIQRLLSDVVIIQKKAVVEINIAQKSNLAVLSLQIKGSAAMPDTILALKSICNDVDVSREGVSVDVHNEKMITITIPYI